MLNLIRCVLQKMGSAGSKDENEGREAKCDEETRWYEDQDGCLVWWWGRQWWHYEEVSGRGYWVETYPTPQCRCCPPMAEIWRDDFPAKWKKEVAADRRIEAVKRGFVMEKVLGDVWKAHVRSFL